MPPFMAYLYDFISGYSSAKTIGAPISPALRINTGRVSSVASPINVGTSFLYYTGFFCRYFCRCVAEELRVVETDVRYDRQGGGDNVRTVKSSAKPNFDYGHINLHVAEIFEGHGSGHLKE